ncbi:MAG: hypothetical protein JST68_03550 [Bacteroidetes bacterium]|nr:hypothetical protein [Bacteroidota bacterium]
MTIIRKTVHSINRTGRLLLKPRAWKRLRVESGVRRQQNRAIRLLDRKTDRLIVFLVPGADKLTGAERISGGIISITSLKEESGLLKEVHGAEVILCTMPEEYLLFQHKLFANNSPVFRFPQLRQHFSHVKEVLFHLPEFCSRDFIGMLDKKDREWIAGLQKVHINVLNQNILLMPSVEELHGLKEIAHQLTMTTAHQRYCTPVQRQHYGVPLHKFSVWISPEKYTFKKYKDKENLIVVSPDGHPMRDTVLERLNAIPGLRVQIIRNLTYEEFKATVAKAKWTLTFGEGLDAYIIEPIFSGAIGFAVYNEDFFTPDFKDLPTLYSSYDELLARIAGDIERLDKEAAFEPYQKEQYDILTKYYSFSEYRSNLRLFYEGKYTFQ